METDSSIHQPGPLLSQSAARPRGTSAGPWQWCTWYPPPFLKEHSSWLGHSKGEGWWIVYQKHKCRRKSKQSKTKTRQTNKRNQLQCLSVLSKKHKDVCFKGAGRGVNCCLFSQLGIHFQGFTVSCPMCILPPCSSCFHVCFAHHYFSFICSLFLTLPTPVVPALSPPELQLFASILGACVVFVVVVKVRSILKYVASCILRHVHKRFHPAILQQFWLHQCEVQFSHLGNL